MTIDYTYFKLILKEAPRAVGQPELKRRPISIGIAIPLFENMGESKEKYISTFLKAYDKACKGIREKIKKALYKNDNQRT